MKELRYRGHIAGLDVLRGVAISLVMVYHGIDARAPWQEFVGFQRWVYYLTQWGATGVHLFFILSGFLITGIIIDSPQRPGFYKRFYFNRTVRIIPAYLLILAVLKFTHHIGWRYILACILYIANMAGLVGASNSEYGAFWSLAVEEQFYLAWPWIVRQCILSKLAKIISAYCILSPFILAAVSRFLPGVDIQYKLWGNVEWLLLGALVAVSLRLGYLNPENIRLWAHGLLIASALTLPMSICLDMVKEENAGGHHFLMQLYRLPVGMFYLALLLYAVLHNRRSRAVLHRGWLPRFFTFMGHISYGLYLVHPLVFSTVDHFTSRSWLGNCRSSSLALIASFLLASLLSVGVAYLSRRFFEERFLRLKDKVFRNPNVEPERSLAPLAN